MTFSYRNLQTAVTAAAAIFACGLLALQAAPAFAQSRYYNVRNDRFATVSSGPQSALVVDSIPGETDIAHQMRVQSLLAANWRRQAQALREPLGRVKKPGSPRSRGAVALSTILVERSGGRLVTLKSPTRAAGGRAFGDGALTFRFTGFSDTDLAYLRPFVDLVYPRIVNLYGAPAIRGEVEIVNAGDSKSGSQTDVVLFSFGAYNASTNQILLPRYSNNDVGLTLNRESTYPALLLNMIHAFHGPAVLQYDAWEQGMARAAAAVIARDPAVQNFVAANGATFFRDDPSAGTFFSLLQTYELLNQPALGNRTFFPASQSNSLQDGDTSAGKMLFVRLGMSGAAWLKVYIENQSFFRQFNANYYAQVSGNANIAGDVPALRTIAGSQLPNGVEALSFSDWYIRQYILDTSVSVGPKVYALVKPGNADDSNLQSAQVTVDYFNTKADGDEILLNGTAYGTYLDSGNNPVQIGTGSAPVQNGEGLFTVNPVTDQTSGVGRYTLNFSVGGLVARTYLPVGFNTDFQGVVAGAGSLSGNLTFQQTTLPPVSSRSGTSSVNNGAFGRSLGSTATDLSVTTVTLTKGTAVSTYRFNTGDGRYYAILRPQGTTTTVTRAFPQTSLPNLVSFPVRPLSVQADAALGLPATDFLLNTWDNTTGGYKAFSSVQAGGARLEPGTGYWLKVGGASGNASVRLTGTPPPTDTDYTIAAPLGWSLIGSPFGTDINLTDIRVQFLQNDPVSWEEAVKTLVQAQVYGFDQSAGYQVSDVLKGSEWKGYWIRARVPGGVTLILPGPDSPTRSQAVRSALTRSVGVPTMPTRSASSRSDRPEWSVRLTAEQNTGGADWTNRETVTLGAARDATRSAAAFADEETPPAIAPGVQIAFTSAAVSGRATGGHKIADFRDSATAARSAAWDMVVSTPVSGPATLRWDGVGTAPRRTRLTLVDRENGTRLPLRSRSSYTWTGEAGKTRAFRVLSEPERSLPLSIININFQPVRNTDGTRSVSGGSGIGLTYSVVGDSDPRVTIDINSPNGRLVRRLDGGAPSELSRAAGNGAPQQRSVRWDGKGPDGSSLPMGTYMVTITAQGSDGTIARVQRPVLMVR